MPETWIILKLLEWTHNYLASKGIETARLDTELLLSHSLNLSRVQLYTQFDRPLREEELKEFKGLLQRRIKREPLAYILGKKEFYSMEFIITPAVLIPRPETELLVEEAIKLFSNAEIDQTGGLAGGGSPPDRRSRVAGPRTAGGYSQDRTRLILDIGTGSGCIAIALAKHLVESKVWATDVSEAALEIAKLNTQRHHVEKQITFLKSNLTSHEKFDLIVSNPPYIPSSEISKLAPEIQYEPKPALDGGPDGLEAYRKIIPWSASHLKPQGLLLVEIGEDQEKAIRQFSAKEGFRNIETLYDLAGKPRVLKIGC